MIYYKNILHFNNIERSMLTVGSAVWINADVDEQSLEYVIFLFGLELYCLELFGISVVHTMHSYTIKFISTILEIAYIELLHSFLNESSSKHLDDIYSV